MALDAFVDSTQLDADLTSVANAIRTKGGTSAQLAFPNGFASAIGDISGGWVQSLSAVFAQGTTRVFTTDELDDLRDRLTVTATYEDSTSEAVDAYELSGTLVTGTSTITVTYGDKMTTFTAVVTEAVDITPAFSDWTALTNTAIIKNTSDNSILAVTNSNGTWRGMTSSSFTVDEGMGYRFTVDMEYFVGHPIIALRNSSANFMLSDSDTVSRTLVIDGIASDSPNYSSTGWWRVFITNGTSSAGRAVFKNIKVIKYSTVTPEQALNALMGG